MKKHDIGKTLKLLRENFNMTQKELSEKIYINKNTLSRFETNSQSPTIDELIAYLTGINVSITDYFTKALELSDESISFNKSIQKILLHYHNHKNAKIYLIQKELIFFKDMYDNMSKNFFNTYLQTDRYIQLYTLYPNYFKSVDQQLINNKAKIILKKKIWLLEDFNYLLVTIHHLTPNNILELLDRVMNTDYAHLNRIERKTFETIIENLTDNFLINRAKYSQFNIDVKDKLELLFNFWELYCFEFQNVENIIIKQHNFSLFELIYKKQNKNAILDKAYRRCELLKELELTYLADILIQELNSYKHDIDSEATYYITS